MVPRKRIFQVAVLCAPLVILGTHTARAQTDYDDLLDGRRIDFDLPFDAILETKSAFSRGNIKIDPAIRALVSESSGLSTRGFGALAKNLAVPLSSQREVAVALTPERGSSVDELIEAVRAHGAEVSVVLDGVVFAHVPLGAVDALGTSEALYFMSRQAELSPAYPLLAAGGRPSDGVRSVHADRLHTAGITGDGVKVGILDFGFERYRELQERGLVPAPAAAQAFNQARRIEATTVHGTACAEIVHAMAPDAELYLAAVDGREDQIILAANWLAAKGVDILSFSGGGHYGPHNGWAVLDRLVQLISLQGVLWVNAAGNEGSRHWTGRAIDRNRDGWIDIGPNGENFLVIQPSVDGIATKVVWDDWGIIPYRPASTEDIDAFLFQYDPNTRATQLVGQSVNPQQGRGPPFEYIAARVTPNRPFVLALRATGVRRPVRVHVYSDLPSKVAPNRPMSSIAIPATSRAALAAGAVDVRTEILEEFSSRGPTDDGRLKPEVSAPDNTLSEAYALHGGRFPGTSAACPHVSGFAALLKQMHPESTRKQLRQAVIESVQAKGQQTPNHDYGHGYIDASGLDLPTGQPALSIDLPDAWGGRVARRGLEELLERSGRNRGLEVKVAVGRSEYRLGDGLKIGYTASMSCYYLLLGRDSMGKYVVIAPLEGDSPRLEGGEKYVLPQGNDVIRITEPTGVDELILVGSRDPIDIGKRRSDTDIAVSRVRYRVVR